jgi:hypothetical protein
VDRGELVAQSRGSLELLRLSSGHHARSERALEFYLAALKKKVSSCTQGPRQR